jgi:hypothetical protein
MADFVFNIAKGREAYYASLPAANDALIVVALQTTGLGTDATLVDDATLTAVLTHATEQTTMGRKTLAGVSVTVDNTNDRVDISATNPVWTGATGNPVSKLVVCYDPDTTTGTDADLIPLSAHDFVVTPNGGDVTATISSPGFLRAS